MGFQVVKNPPANASDLSLIPGQEDPLERKWQPTLVFLLGNLMDRGACWAEVHGIAKELDTI